MIKANELRVGNHLFKYGEVVKIVEIGIKHKGDTNYYLRSENDNCGYWIDQFNPIPLTEEILLKCAKKYQKIIYVSLPKLKAELHFEFVYDPISKKSLGIITTLKSQFSDLILNEIKYLHELQNLYKELEKQELEINL